METPGSPPTLLELMSSLVTAWRNLAAYPPGHPARASALATAHARLRASLAVASPLVLGIAHDGLISGGKKIEATHVRAFARALYRRNGGLLRFEEDVEPHELEAFLALEQRGLQLADPDCRAYVAALKAWMRGNLDWYSETKRYGTADGEALSACWSTWTRWPSVA